jgi:hypothetical protein
MCYDLRVSGLPSKRAPKPLNERQTEALVEALERGEHPLSIAKRLVPDNPKKMRALRRRLEAEMLGDSRVAQRVAEKSKLRLLAGLGPASDGLAKRAVRRNDATKLLFETTGFHNPRVKHEHSGDIKITMDIPRPSFVDANAALDIPEADVVEE